MLAICQRGVLPTITYGRPRKTVFNLDGVGEQCCSYEQGFLGPVMFLRFERRRHRLMVNLVASHRDGGTVFQRRLGRLGAVTLPAPLSAAERIRFWAGFEERWRAIVARHPGRVFTSADRERLRAEIAQRIPAPVGEEVLRVQAIANMMVAVDRLAADQDGMEAAAQLLRRLARETRPNRRIEASA
jgi:hypothetical protein